MNSNHVFVHDTATVEAGASIGRGTRIWHYAHVRTGAIIGEDCTIGKSVFVDAGSRIGNGVKIQNFVSVFNGVTIEDGVLVGPSVTFTNDLFPRVRANADWIVVPTLIETGVGLGANCTIVCGSTIGAFAMVGAGAVVVGDVPRNALVVGNPARQIGEVDEDGNVVKRS